MRLVGAMGFGVGTELMVREVIDKNGDIIEEVLVVADKIDGSDVPPANILFALSSTPLGLDERQKAWRDALQNLSPEELRLLAKDMESLKVEHDAAAVLNQVISEVQSALKGAAGLPSSERGGLGNSIGWLIHFNTTLINWGGLACWWGPPR